MIAILYVIFAGLLILNGLQFMGKIRDELNWPANVIGGLLGLYLALDIAYGTHDEPFVMVAMSNYSFVASLLIVISLSFIMIGLPAMAYNLGPRFVLEGTVRPMASTGYFLVFAGLYTTLSSYAVLTKVDCATMAINFSIIGINLVLLGMATLKEKPRKKPVGKITVVTSVICLLIPGFLMLSFGMVLP